MYRNRLQRIRRKQEERLLLRLVSLFVAIIILIIGFFMWGIPFLISLTELISSYGRSEETPLRTNGEPFFPPRLESLPTATNAATITIRGFGQEGTTAILKQKSQEDETTYEMFVGKDGIFEFSDLSLNPGENTFQAQLKQTDDTMSPQSDVRSVTLDQTPPKLFLSEPDDGSREGPDERQIRILGSTEEGASVTVNDRWVVVNPEGGFEYTFTLEEGENIITIVASDLAGNTVSAVRRITYTKGGE